MSDYNTQTILSNAVEQIADFAKAHQNETFYAFALDAGLLCLNSEESFEKTLKHYQSNWETNVNRVWSIDALQEDELAEFKILYASEIEILGPNKYKSFDDFLEQTMALENEMNADYREKGNPYLLEDKIHDLKYNTGDWDYQGFGELNLSAKDENISDVYNHHYEPPDDLKQTSDYEKLKKFLIHALRKNQHQVFAPIQRTDDFKIFARGHEY